MAVSFKERERYDLPPYMKMKQRREATTRFLLFIYALHGMITFITFDGPNEDGMSS
jgi:hypothetical protein